MEEQTRLQLDNGSHVAVIGGGPAGSFFSYFLLEMAERASLDLRVDIYEPKDFSRAGPRGCNQCGGVVHESLVQILATEGINLPPTVVQRGIDSHILHMGVGSVQIETPFHEMRIGAMYRGAGPRGLKESAWGSLDGHLLSLAGDKGANVIHGRVSEVSLNNGRPEISTRDGAPQAYDLLAVATGVNTAELKLFKELGFGYEPPRTMKTAVREYYLGAETIEAYMGSSVHVFLLNIPRLKFACLIPKGDYVTMCLVGEGINKELVATVLARPEVEKCFPPDFPLDQPSCQCWPRIALQGAAQPFTDRMVFLGDCGVTRFYKDGIGSAYRAAKAAATTAVFQGISAEDFGQHYGVVCRRLSVDNVIGRLVFAFVGQIQKRRFARRAVVRMVSREQQKEGTDRRLSMVMWDMYTGGSPYGEILIRTLHPAFWLPFLGDCAVSLVTPGSQ
jgi:flavin-dependent dehydrogenase